jgi:hypothetical protein
MMPGSSALGVETEQLAGVEEIGRVEALREPFIDRKDDVARRVVRGAAPA